MTFVSPEASTLVMQISITTIPSPIFPSQLLCGPTHKESFIECGKTRTGSSLVSALTGILVSKALKSDSPDNRRLNPRPSKIINAMSIPGALGETVGEETVQQLTPHDQWEWNSRHHWKHWHGLWTMWKPTEGPDIVKTYKSVRSLWPVDEERVHLYHRNQWYETTGEGPDINWESGPWAMYEFKHSLQDGIWHPNSLDHRIIQFPNGDLGWVQLALKPNDPKSVVFNELHFMPSPDVRVPVIIGYDFEGKMGVALMLEETRDNDKRPEPSWQGTIWKHHRATLEESRNEPVGTFTGMEMSLNTNLQMSIRKAVWKGFKGGLSEEDAKGYILIHLPYGLTAFAPREAAVGKAHEYYVSWVVNENQVRVLSVSYFADGRLQHLNSGTYEKSA